MILLVLGNSLHFVSGLAALEYLQCMAYISLKSWHYGDRVRSDSRVISAQFGYITRPFGSGDSNILD